MLLRLPLLHVLHGHACAPQSGTPFQQAGRASLPDWERASPEAALVLFGACASASPETAMAAKPQRDEQYRLAPPENARRPAPEGRPTDTLRLATRQMRRKVQDILPQLFVLDRPHIRTLADRQSIPRTHHEKAPRSRAFPRSN